MKPKHLYLFLFTSFLSLGCFYGCSSPQGKQTSAKPQDPTVSILLKPDEATPFLWPAGLSIASLTFLESERPEHLISFLRHLTVSPDGKTYYLFDQKDGKIVVFDSSGKAKAVFDHQGEGPGDYLEITDAQLDFGKETIEVMDYQQLKKYDLNTFQYLGMQDLSQLPGDKIFRNFVRIEDVLYLWTNLPPNQLVGKEDVSGYHMVRIQDGEVSFHVQKKYGVINGQIFYPGPTKNHYAVPPIVGSADIMAVDRDSVYTKYRFNYGNKGIPVFELEHFWERRDQLINSAYYKPPQNIRETSTHLFFSLLGNGSYNSVLFDKRTNSIQSIGRTRDELDPVVIYSDADYFYAYIDPAAIVNYLESGGDLEKTTFFKDLDVSDLKKYDNPILVKFTLRDS